MNSCALCNRIYYLLIWLWGLKRSSVRGQVRAGMAWPGLKRGQQDVVRPLAGPAWCFTARKPLFLRRGAPRHWPWSSLRRSRRGASLPAIPCFFVEGHHAIGPGRAFGGAGVVPHCPLSLVSSSRGTTPLALVEPSEEPAWCLTALNPLFLRRRAPRPRFPPSGQGAVALTTNKTAPKTKRNRQAITEFIIQLLFACFFHF